MLNEFCVIIILYCNVHIIILTIELTFLDLTLEENSLFRNKQASMPAVVRKTVAITMGTRANIKLF